MYVLAIGNSFSQDAVAYLKKVSDAGNGKITIVNLYIAGCSLAQHYRNMISEASRYSLEFNGVSTGFSVSLKQALLAQEWDVITFQQASFSSPKYWSYQPYLNELAAYARKFCPKAKIMIHETWAYEEGCARLTKMQYESREAMYNDVHAAYTKAAEDINAYGIIPSGTLMQKLIENGVTRLHRDCHHTSLDIGRYSLALLWFRVLTGLSVLDNSYKCPVGVITDEEYEIIKKCVEEIV